MTASVANAKSPLANDSGLPVIGYQVQYDNETVFFEKRMLLRASRFLYSFNDLF